MRKCDSSVFFFYTLYVINDEFEPQLPNSWRPIPKEVTRSKAYRLRQTASHSYRSLRTCSLFFKGCNTAARCPRRRYVFGRTIARDRNYFYFEATLPDYRCTVNVRLGSDREVGGNPVLLLYFISRFCIGPFIFIVNFGALRRFSGGKILGRINHM